MENKTLLNEEKNNKKYVIFNIFFVLFNLSFWAFLYHKLIDIKNIGDYYAHNQFAKWMMEGEFETTYPGYQLLVGIPYKLTGINIGYISVAVLSIFATFTVYMTYTLLTELLKERNVDRYHILILSLVLNIIQPIFTLSIRPGYSSGNGYISPTQAVCKPFIVLVFLCTYRMYINEKYTINDQIKLTIMLFSSCVIKPVFAMAYVPAMGILYLFDEIINKKSLRDKIKTYIIKSWPLVFIGIVLILQYVMSFNLKMPPDTGYSLSEGAGIKIGFLVAWRSVVSNVPLSIIFAYFFPIVLLLSSITCKSNISIKSEDKVFLKLCLFYGIVSLLYMSFLYQETRVSDCNFRNAWIVTFSIIYIFCVSILYKETKEKNFSLPITLINWGAFSAHLIMGLALYIKYVI